MKVALVCDWLTNMGGAEEVLLALSELYPDAPIYTSVYNPEKVPAFRDKDVRTSFLQHVPLAKSKHQLFPTLRPLAFESFDFSEYDLVISSASAEAKGIITKPHTKHICYCHTPTRYYWSDYHAYLNRLQFGILNPIVKRRMPKIVHKMRMWDRLAADRVDHFIANSAYVAARIKKYYRREATVIYPPCDTENLKPGGKQKDFFLAISRLIPYKQVRLIVEAFNELGLPLKVAGTGPEEKELRKIAKDNIEFLGYVSGEEKLKLLQECQSFIFAPEEDFGIAPVEAMACGRPVIAYGKGGATESVNGDSGIFFHEQTVDSLVKAVRSFDASKFDTGKIRERAEMFSKERFKRELKELVARELEAPKGPLVGAKS
ncbi:MAG: glycosyltransferase [Candidatus Gracilibacteria bacterium]|nr:glycosyltransferase [Candidatus Gracilibacteria bacterium]